MPQVREKGKFQTSLSRRCTCLARPRVVFFARSRRHVIIQGMSNTLHTYDQPDGQAAWDELAASASGGHVLQSWAWGELKSAFGWRVLRLATGSAGAQVLFRSLPLGLGSIAYVPKGPMLNYADEHAFRDLLAKIRPLARQQRAICLKIEPDLEDDPALANRLRTLGFRPSPQTIQPRRTILVDLDAEADESLARMKSKTRYNIRLAGRKGVTVHAGDESDLPAFYRLMQLTAKRDGFGIHTYDYYETSHRLFVPSDQGRLLLAEYRGDLLAGLVVLAFGDTACYMYGASSDEHRNLMPAYLLQWEAMRWAREKGCRVYDLWGVPDEDEETLEAQFTTRSEGLWGVYRFKRGFGGRLVRTVGAWDLVYAPLRYWLYTLALHWLNRGQAS
jgi:peptidoglycan pentaglycine glycine transferase (the first glycine)